MATPVETPRDCGSPAYFCNYACLSAYVDERDLTAGAACEWSPE